MFFWYVYSIEFAGEISDTQVPHIAPTLFPEMLKIFTNPQVSIILHFMYNFETNSFSVFIITLIKTFLLFSGLWIKNKFSSSEYICHCGGFDWSNERFL